MYLVLAGVFIFEIYAVIFYADEIAITSNRLSYCIYDSNWTCMSIECQKLIIIISEKWKKPQELIVGKVFAMRMSILTSVCIHSNFIGTSVNHFL